MTFLIVSCSPSNEKKAQKLIGLKLNETLHDFSSYESVKFGSLDTIYTSLLENDEYYNALQKLDFYKTMIELSIGAPSPSVYSNPDSIAFYSKIIDSLEKSFVPQQIGWRMIHTFRSNNAMGNKTIGHYLYTFDLDITKISESRDISESANEE
jgi:hypothetical protein